MLHEEYREAPLKVLTTHTKQEIVALLKAFTAVLEGLSQEEYASLLKGEGRLVFAKTLETKRKPKPQKAKEPANGSVNEQTKLLEFLRQAGSRDDAVKLLQEGAKTKPEMVKLAKAIPVYIAKSDTKAMIQEKIIETVIGSRLATEAINKLDLK